MIRTLVKFLALLLLIAMAPLLIDEKGYILIAMGEFTYELTVVSALFILVILAFLLALLFWGARLGLKISSKTWRKMAFTNKAKAKQQFQQALAAYLLEDYPKAEDLMAKCAESSELANSAWLIAAFAAHKQGLTANTENYLQLINEHPQAQHNFSFETLLAAGKLNLADQQFSKTRILLDNNHKLLAHDARLSGLEIELCLHEQNFEKAIDLLKGINKDKTLAINTVSQWQLQAFSGYFEHLVKSESISSVSKYFKALNRKERQNEGMILAYANSLNTHGLTDQLEDLVLPFIKKDASPTFINMLKSLSIKNSQHIIANIQKILQKQSDNVLWLSALAHLCAANNEHDKAQKAFVTLLKLQQNPDDLKRYAELLETMGEHQQANRVYQELLTNRAL
jgi:HemY protein